MKGIQWQLCMASSRQAVKVQKTITQLNDLCSVLQEDAIVDANFRLKQWQGVVDARQLMDSILNEVQELAPSSLPVLHGRQLLYFIQNAVHQLPCVHYTLPSSQYVSANLYQYSQRSSAQVYFQCLQACTFTM